MFTNILRKSFKFNCIYDIMNIWTNTRIYIKVGLKLKPRIREIRKQRGITQTHIAKQLGVSQQTLSKWEKGEVYPSIKQSYELAKILFVDVKELYVDEQ